MKTSAKISIEATKEQIWAIVSDIESAQERIECIEQIEILEKPSSGMVGLKWKETRKMFGKEAEETMWITEAKENEYYVTQAENSGCIYKSKVEIAEGANSVDLMMSFEAIPQTLLAKLMSPMMFMMKGMIQKAFLKDLEDIKKVALQKTAT